VNGPVAAMILVGLEGRLEHAGRDCLRRGSAPGPAPAAASPESGEWRLHIVGLPELFACLDPASNMRPLGLGPARLRMATWRRTLGKTDSGSRNR
jgi:hypothetical protein